MPGRTRVAAASGGLSISVILPNLNGAKHLQAAIDSFVAQAHPHKELVVVDGMSSDGSHEIIAAACAAYPEVRWVRQADEGISDAFIRGFGACRGQVVGFLGSDDRLAPSILEEVAGTFGMIDADAVWFNSYTWFVAEKRCDLRKPPVQEITRSNLLAHGTLVGWQNIYYRRRVYDAHLPSRECRWAMDYEFLLRIADLGYLFVYVDDVASVNLMDTGTVAGSNISSDLDGRQYRESCAIAAAYADGVTTPIFR
ncbi:glycosyltransferase [Kineococcus sp. R8]|uniref:glycosyltransferase n=1 Tax=Kineococcus siccus TaxID=2696567 RepID=UPI0014124D37|nr:glycosyltransferase [Kineococcus siccus]NAZ83637.1 glycosyltransferase [Kineococcus siccus]